MNTTPTTADQPKQIYAHTLMYPGVPLTSLMSMVGLLMSSNGIVHSIPIDPNFNQDTCNTGNSQADQRFMNEYMALHQTLNSLAREYDRVTCQCQSNGVGLYIHLYCY